MEGQFVVNSSPVKQLIQEYFKKLHHRFFGLYANAVRVGLWREGCLLSILIRMNGPQVEPGAGVEQVTIRWYFRF
jgi:hypothetical protein